MTLFRRLVQLSVAVPLFLAMWAPGCAKQAEGERCDFNRSGNDQSNTQGVDCEDGLICVQADELIDKSTDRCCPPEGTTPSDDRCLRDTGTGIGGSGGTGGTDGGGTGGTGGAAGSGGSAGAAGAGGTAGAAGSAGAAGASGAAGNAGSSGTDGGDASTD